MESVWVEPAVPGNREGVTLVSGFLAGPMCFPPKRCPLSMGSSSDWNGSEAESPPKLGVELLSPVAPACLDWSGGSLPGLADGQD